MTRVLIVLFMAVPLAGLWLAALAVPVMAKEEEPPAPPLPLLEPGEVYQAPGSPRTTIKTREGETIDGYQAHGSKRSSWTRPGGKRLDCYDSGTRIDCR